jgi:hypothetical protein
MRAGVACQRQHWATHKRQCRALAREEVRSLYGRQTLEEYNRILLQPDPSNFPLLSKISAITWTTRPLHSTLHVISLHGRAILVELGRPGPGDTRETLIRLLKRAATELPWPEVPAKMFDVHWRALSIIADLGEPEAAVEILGPHAEDMESKVVDSYIAAYYCIFRLGWLLSAARKFKEDEGKRGAYLAEARGLMPRAIRSLQELQVEYWDELVSDSTSTWSV